MIVRAAAPEEAAAIVAVVHAAFAEYRGRLRPESAALSETAEMVAGQITAHGGFVAEADGRIVGAVLYKVKPDAIYFGRLAVPPAMRGRGIARLLLAAVEDEARRRGRARVTLSVRIALPENQAFFVCNGYREIGRSTHAGFSAPTSIDMAKDV